MIAGGVHQLVAHKCAIGPVLHGDVVVAPRLRVRVDEVVGRVSVFAHNPIEHVDAQGVVNAALVADGARVECLLIYDVELLDEFGEVLVDVESGLEAEVIARVLDVVEGRAVGEHDERVVHVDEHVAHVALVGHEGEEGRDHCRRAGRRRAQHVRLVSVYRHLIHHALRPI